MADRNPNPAKSAAIRRASHSVCAELASRVRSIYITERTNRIVQQQGEQSRRYVPGPVWDGTGRDSMRRQRQAIWPKIAKFVLENRLDPDDYVRTFFIMRAGVRHVEPNHLLSRKILVMYREHGRDEQERKIESAFRFQQEILHNAIVYIQDLARTTGQPLAREVVQRRVLLDEQISLTALFRYCLARNEGLKDVSKRYVVGAVLQFVRYPREYKQIWCEWIPTDFPLEAERIYEFILQNIEV